MAAPASAVGEVVAVAAWVAVVAWTVEVEAAGVVRQGKMR